MPENKLMDDKIRKEVTQIFQKITNPVKVLFFTDGKSCMLCREQHTLLEEIVTLSDKVTLEVYDMSKDSKAAAQYEIDKVPATAIIGKKDYGIRFFGFAGGHEFSSLVHALVMVGSGKSGLSPELENMILEIKTPVHIEVMITLTCPYCPQSVSAAHQLAMVNDYIRADMVESAEFQDLAQEYGVTSTPKTVINKGQHSFVGAMPVQAVFMEVLKAVDPDKYQRVEEQIRESKGLRHVKKAEPEQVYDTIIVGGGPAALSAAVYTARKQMNVLLLSKDIGGQIMYTASVDNYLGLPGVSGQEMREQFMYHAEQYPVAESLGAKVTKVSRKDEVFIVITDRKERYRSHSVIFCTGKEYNRLGVPGEDRFLGHGIAFCATCDAPLYKDKKVAIIGGGNSAFTAARDLMGYAQQVYLLHRKDSFTADPSLVREVKDAKNVTFYTSMKVVEFLGTDNLAGVRVQEIDAQRNKELIVDGVFLEIGLSPNTDAVKDFIKLNERGEIPVSADNTTEEPGFFAAGDVTDVRDKQIVVAAGEGAKAALSAYKYLIDNKLITATELQDEWNNLRGQA
jgi:alkyl hydroperoxide reductase subunit F